MAVSRPLRPKSGMLRPLRLKTRIFFSDFARSKNSYATLRDPEMIRCNLHGAKNECCDHCDPSRVCWNHCDSKCVFCDFARSKNSYATLRDPEMIRCDFALPKKGMLRYLQCNSGILRPLRLKISMLGLCARTLTFKTSKNLQNCSLKS